VLVEADLKTVHSNHKLREGPSGRVVKGESEIGMLSQESKNGHEARSLARLQLETARSGD
jgi:hypothetical protein